MNILLLNWRDPKHPKAGGAEKLNMHILRPLLDRGDSIVWYAMSQSGLPKEEIYEGIKIIRFGNYITHFLLWPLFLYTKRFGKVDFIIDSIHGIGYFSTLIAPFTKKRILICEVAQNIWDEMWPFPVNKIGKLLERLLFIFYKHVTFWTISQSTKQDLRSFGISENQIVVLPMGFDAPSSLPHLPKTATPSALFVGRLAEMKGIKDAIKTIKKVNQKVKTPWTLRIIGRGNETYEKELKELVKQMGMEKYITFLGFVSEKIKFQEMGKSWVLLVPSSREGWGMIIPEANHMGTVAIGYDVAGIRDVIRKYAKKNVLVKKEVVSLVQALERIHKAEKIQEKFVSGWKELYVAVPRLLSQ